MMRIRSSKTSETVQDVSLHTTTETTELATVKETDLSTADHLHYAAFLQFRSCDGTSAANSDYSTHTPCPIITIDHNLMAFGPARHQSSRGCRETATGRSLPSQKYRALNRSICFIRSINARSCRAVATFLTNAFASVSVSRNTK